MAIYIVNAHEIIHNSMACVIICINNKCINNEKINDNKRNTQSSITNNNC